MLDYSTEDFNPPTTEKHVRNRSLEWVTFETVNCIVCGKKACIWTGSVVAESLKGPVSIQAGFCGDKCFDRRCANLTSGKPWKRADGMVCR